MAHLAEVCDLGHFIFFTVSGKIYDADHKFVGCQAGIIEDFFNAQKFKMAAKLYIPKKKNELWIF